MRPARAETQIVTTGEDLARLRRLHGFKQADIAAHMDVARQRCGVIEQLARVPPGLVARYLRALEEALAKRA